jgi:hypothetical protein
MSSPAGFRPLATFLTCCLAMLIAAAPALGQGSRGSSRGSSPRNSSSNSSGKKPSKTPSNVKPKSSQKINNADADKPGPWARFKKFFGFGDKKSKKAPSSKGRQNSIFDAEDLDYGPTYDRVPSEVADAVPDYDRVPNQYDVAPSGQGNQAGGGGQYQPGPVVQNANNPYAPGPVANPHPYDLRGLKVQANQQNPYNNRGLKVSGNNVDVQNAGAAAVVAGAAAGKPPIQYGQLGRNPAPSNQNYAAAPANPQARAGWQPNPGPIGKQNPLARNQFAGKNTMEVAQMLDPSIRGQQGGAGGNAGGNRGGGNVGGQARQGIGQGGQNLGAMAGFNRGGGQPYVVPLQRVLPPGQNIYPNIKRN